MDRVLVLGGAGFIGHHLLRQLAGQGGSQITVVDNMSRGQLDPELRQTLDENPQIELKTADLTDPASFDSLSGPYGQVYLLAGIVGVRNVENFPAKVLRTNVKVVFNTLDWLDKVGCGRLFFASTSETYGASVDLGVAPVPTPEDVPLGVVNIQHPRSTYALSKMLGEASVIHQAAASGYEAVIVRYHNVYGPRMGMDHVIPELMQRCFQKINPMPVFGMTQTRAFCYVSDAVRASRQLMECPLDGVDLVHVGNDQEEVTISVLLDKVLEVTGFHPQIQQRDAPPGAVARRCPDISKLRKLTGFEPAVNLADGLDLTWNWYRDWLSMKPLVGDAR